MVGGIAYGVAGDAGVACGSVRRAWAMSWGALEKLKHLPAAANSRDALIILDLSSLSQVQDADQHDR